MVGDPAQRMCPRPVIADHTARACIESGNCGCDESLMESSAAVAQDAVNVLVAGSNPASPATYVPSGQTNATIGDAIIAGIDPDLSALEQMSNIATNLERAGYEIVERAHSPGEMAFVCPRCGARGTTDGKSSTVSSTERAP